MPVIPNDLATGAQDSTCSVWESDQPEPDTAGLTEYSGYTGLHERAGFYEAAGNTDIAGIWQLLDELRHNLCDRLVASSDTYRVLDPGDPSTSWPQSSVRGSATEFRTWAMYSSPFDPLRGGNRPFPCLGGEYMLYDREDRMSRPMFLREYDIEGSTEKRARAEGLPWPPYVVMGGRVYYSRRLVACWFEQQAGLDLTQAVEASNADQIGQAEQEHNAKAGVDD
jgi:hypothetical protein